MIITEICAKNFEYEVVQNTGINLTKGLYVTLLAESIY